MNPRQGEKSCFYEDLFSGQDERLTSEFSRLERLEIELKKQDDSLPTSQTSSIDQSFECEVGHSLRSISGGFFGPFIYHGVHLLTDLWDPFNIREIS